MAVPIYEPITIDCSEHNCLNYEDYPDDTGINFALLAQMADRVIIRFSVGAQEDLRGQQIYDGLKPYADMGLVEICAYHAMIEWVDTETQVELFADLCNGKTLTFVMADFERDSSGLSQNALATLYLDFLGSLTIELTLVPYSIVIYTAEWFWGPNIGMVMAVEFGKYRLMFAQYTLVFTNLLIPFPWQPNNWTWHQYAADGNGMGAVFGFPGDDIDMSRMNPSLPQPPPSSPPPLVFPLSGKVSASAGTNLRPYPNVISKWIPGKHFTKTLPKDTPLLITGEEPDAFGYGWWVVKELTAGWHGVVAKQNVTVI